MSWDEDAARRLRDEQAWEERFRPRPDPRERPFAAVLGGSPASAAVPFRCNCGGHGDDDPPYPAALADLPPASGQPAAVLLAWQLGHRAMPGDARENARLEAVAELAGERLDGRAALRMLNTGRNPDGSPKSGSAARAVMRDLSVTYRHHWSEP